MRMAAVQPSSTDSKNVNDLITSNTTLTVVDADKTIKSEPAQDYLALNHKLKLMTKLNQVIISQ